MFVPATLQDPRRETLTAAAFGDRPGLAAAELPAAADAYEHWLRAVVLGGQGYYAAARAELGRIRRTGRAPITLSLAASTEGSLLRQLGGHADAAAFDGRALAVIPFSSGADSVFAGALADPDVPTTTNGVPGTAEAAEFAEFATPPDRIDAVCDAMTGLAADAIGTGRLDLAWRLLHRVGGLAHGRPRALVRLHWVSAETALAAGRPDRARPHAETALALAEAGPSVRHRVKSALILAAVATASGDVDSAAELAAGVARGCTEHGLVPLAWACAMLRIGLGDQDAADESAACGELIARRGGRFRTSGPVRHGK
ncbi:hypothetical protein [Nocardia bovistercoris]|uniref:Uncharacterized protein n=1 Tax=Nocardia bovistercoris TaxID=2785916 RepID=A0A931IC94_9NOCA|nr:hypothetical protein [Nocardia bovistercoris]MBH0777512.1 hypothetical protein [Nocardia bovistercoris]